MPSTKNHLSPAKHKEPIKKMIVRNTQKIKNNLPEGWQL
jgi:hypothetical protein